MNRYWMLGLLIACPHVARAGDEVGVKQTIAYVQKLQTSNGGFLSMTPKPNTKLTPTLRATSAGVRTLKYLGGDVPNPEAAAKFVMSCYDEGSGGFSDLPKGKADVFTTAVGLMAVKELKLPADKHGPSAVKFLAEKAKTFEEIRIAVAGLEAIDAKSPKAEDWIGAVRKLQNDDGTFGKGAGQAGASSGGSRRPPPSGGEAGWPGEDRRDPQRRPTPQRRLRGRRGRSRLRPRNDLSRHALLPHAQGTAQERRRHSFLRRQMPQ